MKKKQPTPTKVFLGKAKTFAGEPLHPMTKQREVVAADMGLRYGFSVDYKPSYFLRDTIIVLWLCTIPAESEKSGGWSVDKCEMEPGLAVREALAWAARAGVGIKTDRFMEGYQIFRAIMQELQASAGVPVMPSGTEPEPDVGEA